VLQCVAVCCNMLQYMESTAARCQVCCSAPHRKSVLQCDAVHCSVLQCVAVLFAVRSSVLHTLIHGHTSNLHCVAVCCSALQCVAVCCSLLQCFLHWLHLQCATVCRNVLYCVAVRCSVLQVIGVLQCSAVCCSVLQCATAYRNVL